MGLTAKDLIREKIKKESDEKRIKNIFYGPFNEDRLFFEQLKVEEKHENIKVFMDGCPVLDTVVSMLVGRDSITTSINGKDVITRIESSTKKYIHDENIDLFFFTFDIREPKGGCIKDVDYFRDMDIFEGVESKIGPEKEFKTDPRRGRYVNIQKTENTASRIKISDTYFPVNDKFKEYKMETKLWRQILYYLGTELKKRFENGWYTEFPTKTLLKKIATGVNTTVVPKNPENNESLHASPSSTPSTPVANLSPEQSRLEKILDSKRESIRNAIASYNTNPKAVKMMQMFEEECDGVQDEDGDCNMGTSAVATTATTTVATRPSSKKISSDTKLKRIVLDNFVCTPEEVFSPSVLLYNKVTVDLEASYGKKTLKGTDVSDGGQIYSQEVKLKGVNTLVSKGTNIAEGEISIYGNSCDHCPRKDTKHKEAHVLITIDSDCLLLAMLSQRHREKWCKDHGRKDCDLYVRYPAGKEGYHYFVNVKNLNTFLEGYLEEKAERKLSRGEIDTLFDTLCFIIACKGTDFTSRDFLLNVGAPFVYDQFISGLKNRNSVYHNLFRCNPSYPIALDDVGNMGSMVLYDVEYNSALRFYKEMCLAKFPKYKTDGGYEKYRIDKTPDLKSMQHKTPPDDTHIFAMTRMLCFTCQYWVNEWLLRLQHRNYMFKLDHFDIDWRTKLPIWGYKKYYNKKLGRDVCLPANCCAKDPLF